MKKTEFKDVQDIIEVFPDEQACIDYLEIMRWHGDVKSPYSPQSKVYKCKNNRYRCKESGKYFNVKTETLFDNTKLELRKWFIAIFLAKSKMSISSVELSEILDITQKSAWKILQRIKHIN